MSARARRGPSTVDLEVALLAERRARGRDGQRMRSAATSTVDLWPCWHCVCTWWRRQVRGQASSSQASRSQGTAPDEPPALIADSSDEEEPVSGVRIDASPGKPDFFDASLGKPDFFVTLTTDDEFTLETQSRGKLHTHSRVKNVASVHTYVERYVAKDNSKLPH